MFAWIVFFGAIVGLSLGLTGGGGAIFAVPLLVYGVGVSVREAIGISLAAVGTTSLIGFVHRWLTGEVEVSTGLLFAVTGMVTAPVGSWLATLIPEYLLLLLFAGVMVVIAIRMWQSSTPTRRDASGPSGVPPPSGSVCLRDAGGDLRLNSRCTLLLLALGAITGVMSGLFGVGGGFIIVPALVLFVGMPIHRAVGTSLLVIALVSASGVISHSVMGRDLSLAVTAWFIIGGIGGLFVGQQIGKHLSGPYLQRVFAAAILVVAAFIVAQHLAQWPPKTGPSRADSDLTTTRPIILERTST
jgi:uncharacterized membrane protein YfcA